MRIKLIILSLILLPFSLITSSSKPVSAFDVFSNCTTSTQTDGTQAQQCGPCHDNTTAPSCQQANSQGNNDPIAGPNGIISTAANIIALVTGVGAVIMIILGGFAMVTSAGNPESTKKGRQQITSALIGLVVIAFSWALVRLITDKVIG